MATPRRGGPGSLVLLGFVFLLTKGADPSRADDTVAAGRPLSGGQSLVSKRAKFRLGFFRPGTRPPAPHRRFLLDPRGGTSQYLLNWNSSQQYWSSGNWTGHSFTAVPEMMASDASPVSQYSFGYVDGAEESYFVYDVKDEAVVTRFLVDVTGQIKFLTWAQAAGGWVQFWAEPKAQCDVYALCGAFAVCTENAVTPCACLRGFSERSSDEWRQGDRTSGCARNAHLHCSSDGSVHKKDDVDGFYTMPNVRLPQQSVTTAVITSIRECELACLANCSCTAYSYSDRTCSLWYGDLVNLQDTTSAAGTGRDGRTSISIRLAASEFSATTSGTWKKKKLLVTGLVVVAATVLLTLLVFDAGSLLSQYNDTKEADVERTH
ncbi:hypothetical protein PR202_ga08797 [Eleusine coracana subsp. coracana]|uniref:Apple domain-containing protein n=1 Tax=Eleusine coracana subsp. coracana TaxID=191504 RepID=A0AAV5C3I0_ELECO|nr:hypothetical protein PR202_ga08797 [Eleusine coracana subsp. coracana]